MDEAGADTGRSSGETCARLFKGKAQTERTNTDFTCTRIALENGLQTATHKVAEPRGNGSSASHDAPIFDSLETKEVDLTQTTNPLLILFYIPPYPLISNTPRIL